MISFDITISSMCKSLIYYDLCNILMRHTIFQHRLLFIRFWIKFRTIRCFVSQMGLSHKYKKWHFGHIERSEISININDFQGRGLASLNRKNDFFTSFRMTTYETAPSYGIRFLNIRCLKYCNSLLIHSAY